MKGYDSSPHFPMCFDHFWKFKMGYERFKKNLKLYKKYKNRNIQGKCHSPQTWIVPCPHAPGYAPKQVKMHKTNPEPNGHVHDERTRQSVFIQWKSININAAKLSKVVNDSPGYKDLLGWPKLTGEIAGWDRLKRRSAWILGLPASSNLHVLTSLV